MRLVLFALVATVALGGCDVLAPFDADRGSYSATVTGDQRLSLRGSGYYSPLTSDQPPLSGILLTDTDDPAIRFEFDGATVSQGRHAIPGEARARFEPHDPDEAAYVATGGHVEITSVSREEARGTFSFTATRPGGTVTVTGEFVAEAEVLD